MGLFGQNNLSKNDRKTEFYAVLSGLITIGAQPLTRNMLQCHESGTGVLIFGSSFIHGQIFLCGIKWNYMESGGIKRNYVECVPPLLARHST
jgi:hypothetical protein